MSYEILYTSAPSGLKPGSSGYCTVQGSRGIPAPAVDLLESLSGYRHVFTPGSPDATHNPVNWGHYLIRIAGRVEHVLSRVGDCELDYTGRSNKLAHHLVVDASTTATLPGGPAWFLSRPGLMYDQWDGTVSHLGTPRIPPPERRTGGKCAAWGAATGDSGWGGVLAESFLADPERKVFVVYAPGTNVLALFEEAIALLPEHRRWDVTFATYGAALPKTVDCLWSGLVAGSPEVAQSHRFVNALRIDLTDRVGRAVGGPLVELARTGKAPARTSPLPRHPVAQSHVPSTMEAVYEGGYQPVPPPPDVLSPSANVDGPEPPSLPPRTQREHRSLFRGMLLALSLLFIATLVTGWTFLWLKKQPSPRPADATQDGQVGPETRPSGADSEVADSPTREQSSPEPNTPDAIPKNDLASNTPGEQQPKGPPTPPMNSDTEKVPVPPSEATRQSMPKETTPNEAGSPSVAPVSPKAPRPPEASTVTEASDQSEPRITYSVQPPTFPAQPKGTSFQLISKANERFAGAARTKLFIPRGRNTDNYFDRSFQFFEENKCKVGAKNSLGSIEPEFAIELQNEGTTTNASIQVLKALSNEEWRKNLSRGALQLLDATGAPIGFIAFRAPSRTVFLAATSANFEMDIELPDHLEAELQHIHADDLFLDEIEIAVDGTPLEPVASDRSSMEWNVADTIGNSINRLELKKSSFRTTKRDLHITFNCPDHKKRVEQLKTHATLTLARKFDAIKSQLGRSIQESKLNPIHPNGSPTISEQTVDGTKRTIVGIVNSHYDKQATRAGDNQDAKKAVEQERTKVLDDLNQYLTELKEHRERMSWANQVGSRVKVTSGVLKHVVRAVNSEKSDQEKAPTATVQPDLAIDLWRFETAR